ncbi:MAG: hypothetical protein FWD58_02860 [Firmicutes bacterium]|nr:hypothetical protein [Bacillota bacterium]
MSKYKKILDVDEAVEVELAGTPVKVLEEDVEAFFESLMERVKKLFARLSKYMTDNNQTTDGLLLFLDKYAELFACDYDTISRDIIKWSLAENIKKSRALIDKIQEIEKRLGLDIHHEW